MQKFDVMNVLSQNIRELMNLRGMRQQDLSEATGIHRPSISRLLTNPEANPQLSTLELIAKALGVRVCDLLEEKSKKVAG